MSTPTNQNSPLDGGVHQVLAQRVWSVRIAPCLIVLFVSRECLHRGKYTKLSMYQGIELNIAAQVNRVEKWSVLNRDLKWENHSAMVDRLSLKLHNDTQTDSLNSILSLYGRGIRSLRLRVGAWWHSESMGAIARCLGEWCTLSAL